MEGDKAVALLNSKINDIIEGDTIGLPGYRLKITGGSDNSGFPLMKGIGGAIKTSVLRKVATWAGITACTKGSPCGARP